MSQHFLVQMAYFPYQWCFARWSSAMNLKGLLFHSKLTFLIRQLNDLKRANSQDEDIPEDSKLGDENEGDDKQKDGKEADRPVSSPKPSHSSSESSSSSSSSESSDNEGNDGTISFGLVFSFSVDNRKTLPSLTYITNKIHGARRYGISLRVQLDVSRIYQSNYVLFCLLVKSN